MDYVDYDDTLPLPADVEFELRERSTGHMLASEWLTEHGVDASRQPQAGYFSSVFLYGERSSFRIYSDEHIGPKYPAEIAIPIFDQGTLVDLLLIDPDTLAYRMVTCRAKWLGAENLSDKVVRLHAHPIDWIESGFVGVCHVEAIGRKALKGLRTADSIICSDVHTALEAWDWAYGAEDEYLPRFVIDAEPDDIRDYFQRQARWQAMNVLRRTASDTPFPSYQLGVRS